MNLNYKVKKNKLIYYLRIINKYFIVIINNFFNKINNFLMIYI
jgi:hypothetical protein